MLCWIGGKMDANIEFQELFMAKREVDQIKCPYCGSKETSKIIYGIPVMTEELAKEFRFGKIILGGCKKTEMETEDGTQIILDPQRYCNHCQKEFAFPPYYWKRVLVGRYEDMTEMVEFEVGGYSGGTKRIRIKKNDKGASVHYIRATYVKDPTCTEYQITKQRWMRLVDRLYNKLYIHEWEEEYVEPGVFDGTQWHLKITIRENHQMVIYGSNSFPPYWNELNALFCRFMKE